MSQSMGLKIFIVVAIMATLVASLVEGRRKLTKAEDDREVIVRLPKPNHAGEQAGSPDIKNEEINAEKERYNQDDITFEDNKPLPPSFDADWEGEKMGKSWIDYDEPLILRSTARPSNNPTDEDITFEDNKPLPPRYGKKRPFGSANRQFFTGSKRSRAQKSRLPEEFNLRYNRSRVAHCATHGVRKFSWAYAAAAALEGQQAENNLLDENGHVMELNTTELIRNWNGDISALPAFPFQYVNKFGLSTRSKSATCCGGVCSSKRMLQGMIFFGDLLRRGESIYPVQTNAMLELITRGPLMVGLDEEMIEQGGFETPMDCWESRSANYWVLLTGYDRDSYIIKSFRGQDWGDGGYGRIKRDEFHECNPFTVIVAPS